MDGNHGRRRVRGITAELQEAAWRLRRGMTPAELVLWDALRDRRLLGLRFRRQSPVGQFVLDFYCPAYKLAVELDGSVHDGQAVADAARTEVLNTYGVRVVRFRNQEVFSNLPAVLNEIAKAAQE